jgi:cell cycle arrest protein BUB3
MALSNHRLVVGTSGRHVYIYDVRSLAVPEQIRESSLMNQTRCIRAFPDGTGYSLSSTEGRVAIEYFDPSPNVQKQKYAFKCHRKTQGKTQTLYPVNCMAFHPVYGTFATGGCDGLINLWDWQNKKRICQVLTYTHTHLPCTPLHCSPSTTSRMALIVAVCCDEQYPTYPTSIAALAFNRTGTQLAIASSYTWEEGEKEYVLFCAPLPSLAFLIACTCPHSPFFL